MPADHLAPADTLETTIAKVLTGTPLTDAASAVGMEAAALADAIEVYRQAGRRALDYHTNPGWWQVYIRFTDWDLAEPTVTNHLAPLLQRAETDGVIAAWWFIRKHPCWRLRLQLGPAGRAMTADLSAALGQLTTGGQIGGWWSSVYEAETAAFGGNPGIDIAHDLFCADSRAIITMLRDDQTTLGRRELSLLLCSTLMRAANLEWYEQGDVWHRITQERPLPTDIPTAKMTTMADEIKHVMLADITPNGPLLGASGPAGLRRQLGRGVSPGRPNPGSCGSQGHPATGPPRDHQLPGDLPLEPPGTTRPNTEHSRRGGTRRNPWNAHYSGQAAVTHRCLNRTEGVARRKGPAGIRDACPVL
ncbi:MAG: thiopeptide-type bacteriocin biosynthesis protein [Pseudonocardiaceae bacterium]